MIRRMIVAALALLAFSGCWTVHRYDPATVAAIRETITNRQADERWLISSVTLTAIQQHNYQALNKSEVGRLEAWLWREEQKRAGNDDE